MNVLIILNIINEIKYKYTFKYKNENKIIQNIEFVLLAWFVLLLCIWWLLSEFLK